MKIVIGSDHGGYDFKSRLFSFLKKKRYNVEDYGTHSKDSCDYPLIGFEVAEAVSSGRADRGILICRSGIGMAIIANKLPGVRAAACYNRSMTKASREHNDCNVLVLAADYTALKDAKGFADIWLKTAHLGQRHARRVKQISQIEKKLKGNPAPSTRSKMKGEGAG